MNSLIMSSVCCFRTSTRRRTRLMIARTCWQPSTVFWTAALSFLPRRLEVTSCSTRSLASNEKCSERGRRSRTASCRRNRPAFSRTKVRQFSCQQCLSKFCSMFDRSVKSILLPVSWGLYKPFYQFFRYVVISV